MSAFKYGITISDISSQNAPVIFNGSYKESIRKAAKIGFDAVEVHIRNPIEAPYEEIMSACGDSDIFVAAMATGWSFVNEGLSFIDEDPVIRKKAILRFKEYMDLAKHLRCMVIVGLMRGNIHQSGEYDKCLIRFRDALSEIVDYAEKREIVLILEAINRFETNYMNNLYESVKLIDSFGNCPIGLHVDTFHMNIEDVGLIKTIRDCAKWIKYVHYSDSNRLIPGAGNIDFFSITKSLQEIDYKGIITIESLPQPSPDDAATYGLEYLKSIENVLRQNNILEGINGARP